MSRWIVWLVPVLVVCGWIFAGRATAPALLVDTDTSALLAELDTSDDALEWFKGDWPLKNHFYRPVSTLSFQMDKALYGGVAAGYGLTNALLAMTCVLLVFWLMRELTDSPLLSGAIALVFGQWHLGEAVTRTVASAVALLAFICLLGYFRRGIRAAWPCVSGALVCFYASSQLTPVESFASRIVHWLPGRTASTMTLFGLVCLASFARYVRTTGGRPIGPATATDVPATRGSAAGRLPKSAWSLLVVSSVSLLLALGCYEQAVVIPALLVGVWILFAVQGRRTDWRPLLVFWSILIVYAVVRSQLVPTSASGYQLQQFRSGPGVGISLGDYLFPAVYMVYLSAQGATLTTVLLFMNGVIPGIANGLGNTLTLASGWRDRQRRALLFGFLSLAVVAFLPMAWLKQFGHYHYLPSVFRAGFAVVLLGLALQAVATSVSPQAVRAPRRPGPAPGSLLRQ